MGCWSKHRCMLSAFAARGIEDDGRAQLCMSIKTHYLLAIHNRDNWVDPRPEFRIRNASTRNESIQFFSQFVTKHSVRATLANREVRVSSSIKGDISSKCRTFSLLIHDFSNSLDDCISEFSSVDYVSISAKSGISE